MRIAIIGAGVAGPTLAAILARVKPRPIVHLFERDARVRDQGTGYDLNQRAREALQKAGVFHRYAEMCRPDSNIMATYVVGNERPLFKFTQPRRLQRWIPPKLETNREVMRDILLEEIEHSATVRFECAVQDARRVDAGAGIELLGDDGTPLGEFDLCVDTSGVRSPLRRLRIEDDSLVPKYTGTSMVHGIIRDPELQCDPKLVRHLGQGTATFLGPRGANVTLQRYGARPEDHRTSFYFFFPANSFGELAQQIGLPESTSFTHDREMVARARSWLHGQLPNWSASYRSAVDAIGAVAIRPIVIHTASPRFRTSDLPLICIGDALHVVPPWTGVGGNLAMHDALDVGEYVSNVASGSTPLSIDGLRALEQKLVARLPDVHKTSDYMMKMHADLRARLAGKDDVSGETLSSLFGLPTAAVLALLGAINSVFE
jgi:2-polyprenyl-6-methoxyphenol hydroxylase-like FAD-dependent oxidoreductase